MTRSRSEPAHLAAAAYAEAAAWVARLQGPSRSEDVEKGFRRWLTDDPDHAAAFELMTDTWEKSAQLKRRPLERVASWERVGFRLRFSNIALATVCTFVMAVIATLVYLHTDAVSTGVGEYRTLSLEDGTRVHLNTNTRIVVRFDKRLRRLTLDHGEALFEVAKRPDWPFVVSAAGHEIRALGTAFVVRAEQQQLAVTLMEGKVNVSQPGAKASQISARSADSPPRPSDNRQDQSTDNITLSPGQRLTFVAASRPRIDRPALERVTAWERGQVSFDNTPLNDAIAEMNRYSRLQIVLSDPQAIDVRVSGIFEAGDSNNFAQALARTYRLRLRSEDASHIVLTYSPAAASEHTP